MSIITPPQTDNYNQALINQRAAECLRQTAIAYEQEIILPGKNEYYQRTDNSHPPLVCALGGLMMTISRYQPSRIQELLKDLDTEEVFDEMEISLDDPATLAYKTARDALAQAPEYRGHRLIKEAEKARPWIIPASVINDCLLPDGNDRMPTLASWLRQAADILETANATQQ